MFIFHCWEYKLVKTFLFVFIKNKNAHINTTVRNLLHGHIAKINPVNRAHRRIEYQ